MIPQRRNRQLPVTEVGDRIEVQTLEDLVDLALHDINGLVGLINPSQPNSKNQHSDEDLNTDWPEGQVNPSHPETSEPKTFESELSDSEEENMVDENIENNPNDNQQPWLLCDALAIPRRQHHLPKHPGKLLPRFNPT